MSAPLNASEHLKVVSAIVLGPILALFANVSLFFLHVSLIPVGWIVSVIPMVFGYFMMRKNRDFEFLEITAKFTKTYFRLLFLLSSIVAAGFLFLVFSRDMSFYGETLQDIARHFSLIEAHYWPPRPPQYSVDWVNVGSPFLPLVSSYLCIKLIQRLYIEPLSNHRYWVVQFGIFSKDKRSKNQEPCTSPSVADHE